MGNKDYCSSPSLLCLKEVEEKAQQRCRLWKRLDIIKQADPELIIITTPCCIPMFGCICSSPCGKSGCFWRQGSKFSLFQ